MDRGLRAIDGISNDAVHPLNAPSTGVSNDTGARFHASRVCNRAVGVAACRPVAVASITASSVDNGAAVAPRSKRAKLRSNSLFPYGFEPHSYQRHLKVR